MKKIFRYALIASIILLPFVTHVALAATSTSSVTLINPLGDDARDVRVLFGRVISAALSIVGGLSLLMFVYGGVLWMTSRGDSKQITTGKDTVTWATLGLVIIFASYTLVNALISGLTSGNAT